MSPTARVAIVGGAVIGALSVATGAFGAHGLKAVLEASGQAGNWETASRYAMYHGLALVGTGLLSLVRPTAPGLAASTACFILGTLIFSGCLGTLALTGVTVLGAIVPIGGTLMIAGWILLASAAARTTV